MHFQTASSSSDLTSESSDDEKYLLQVPVEKTRIVKSYKRVKTQLRSLKKKKKMLRVQEKVMKEEKFLLKNLLFRSSETENINTSIRRKPSDIKEEASEYKYDETDLLIQIQREELLNKTNISHKVKTEIFETDESIKCQNSDELSQAQDLADKYVKRDMNLLNTDKNNIIHNTNLNETGSYDTQINKSVDQCDETKSQIDQDTDQPEKTCKEDKDKLKHKNGQVVYKMIDKKNGYYINITVPVKPKRIFFMPCKTLLKNMTPIMKEFSDFIPIELFMCIIRKLLQEQISELLIGKERMRTSQIVKLFREKYPDQKDGYYVVRKLVAIWRGDFNDPPDPDDPYNKLITERDPKKLVSYEDIWNSRAVWEIVTTLPENSEENTKKSEKVDSAPSKTDLDDSCSESAKELKVKKEMDSSFGINEKDDIELKEEVTSPNWIHKTEEEINTTDEVISSLKRPYEANSEKEDDTYLVRGVKKLRSKEVEMSIKCANISQTNNNVARGIEK